MTDFGVALIGWGTVGQGVLALLRDRRDELAGRTSVRFELRHVIDKDLTTPRDVPAPPEVLGDDYARVLADEQTHAVVELVGGTGAAKQIILEALAAGKDVVTANKALLAHHGRELFAAARRAGRCIAFEASCGGGIPLVESIRRGLAANRITALYGILNGTCNYILTSMLDRGIDYADALAEAQQHGYAEADPTLDVSGTDAAHKLTILASIAFGTAVDLERVEVAGIDCLELTDLTAARELGYRMKLLAIGERDETGVALRVHPALVPVDHPLASVAGPFNAVSVYGDAAGHTLYYGRGAGRMPTASAVVADLIDVAIGNAGRTFERLHVLPDVTEAPAYRAAEQIESRYYVRIMLPDQPGMMAQVTRVFGDHQISLSAVAQHEVDEHQPGRIVPVVVTTHHTPGGTMQRALRELKQLEVVAAEPVCVPVVDEHPEF